MHASSVFATRFNPTARKHAAALVARELEMLTLTVSIFIHDATGMTLALRARNGILKPSRRLPKVGRVEFGPRGMFDAHGVYSNGFSSLSSGICV
jgi:hypothetical protein